MDEEKLYQTTPTTPFPQKHELYEKLVVSPRNNVPIRRPSSKNQTLPGEPRISLNSPSLPAYLEEDFLTPDLNIFTPWLWLVATQSSKHVTALTSQKVRGRDVILSENPELHLVWIDDHIFVKPIPKYLFSYAFWSYYLDPTNQASALSSKQRIDIGKAARCFLRSYAYIIKRKSDFQLAKEHGLLPRNLGYAKFVSFISNLEKVEDSEVSPRYTYGELRLSRLNFWSLWALGRIDFHKSEWQYSNYFAKFYGPILFAFGSISIVLGAMQVGLAAVEDDSRFQSICWGTVIATLLGVAAVVARLLFVLSWKLIRELVFALRSKWRKRKSKYIMTAGG